MTMGTWSAAIFGNDTSCEVKEHFFELYNLGKEPLDIRNEILALYNMNDKEEKTNVLFALAHCLWQTKALDSGFLSGIKGIIASGEDLTVCRELGANAKFLREREKALAKLISDIETPKETAKRRVKPPVQVDSVYRNGCCLAFRYEDGQWGLVITAHCEYYRRKAFVYYVQTDIKQGSIPTMDEVHSSHLLDNYFDKTSQFDHHHKLHLYDTFLNANEIARLIPYNEAFFTIIGYLPEWKNVYSSSSSGSNPYGQETYEAFIEIIGRYFSNKFENSKRTKETVDEISEIFSRA